MKDNFFKSTQHHKFLKNYIKSDLSWDNVIYNIDINTQENYSIKSLSNYGIVIHNIFNIEKVNIILDEIKKNNTNHNHFSAHMYISLSKKSKTFGKHKDCSDVWFWQCIGKTNWEVFENNQIYSYILDPGDFIYVPKNIFHNVIPMSPRVGISFGMDYSFKILYT